MSYRRDVYVFVQPLLLVTAARPGVSGDSANNVLVLSIDWPSTAQQFTRLDIE